MNTRMICHTQKYEEVFNKALRKMDINDRELLNEGAVPATGYTAPDVMSRKFYAMLAKDDLFRRFGTVVSSGNTSGTIIAAASEGEAEWLGENEFTAEISDSISRFKVSYGKLSSMVRLKDSFVSDNMFDVEGYLSSIFARRFGRAEEDGFLNGDGTSEKPEGILKSAAVTAVTEGASITYQDIKKLYRSLGRKYRANAAFVVSDDTAIDLRELKSDSGAFLWNGDNDTIFGRPVVTSQFMPDASASGNKAVLLADISYYWIVEREPLSIKVLRELYSSQNMTGYVGTVRLYGKMTQPEAAAVLTIK
jgi:Predicted phage phi-C31 gp36 major capsid-like protein